MSITSAETPSLAGSSLLKESPPFGSSSHTGPGGADLSLSELYISDRSEDASSSKPFSLLPQSDENDQVHRYNEDEDVFAKGDAEEGDAEEGDATIMNKGKNSLSASRTREERLEHDLFVLKKLNTSFSLYNDALKDTRSSTENVALQLDRTDRLLDQYVNLLQYTEKNSKLIFDELWEGGGADQETLERLRVEAMQRAKREQEERERAAQFEAERREREEQERKAKEEREARDRDRKGSAPVRGVRGVRGLRSRGTERGAAAVARGRIPSASSTSVKRGASDLSSRGSTISRGVRKS